MRFIHILALGHPKLRVRRESKGGATHQARSQVSYICLITSYSTPNMTLSDTDNPFIDNHKTRSNSLQPRSNSAFDKLREYFKLLCLSGATYHLPPANSDLNDLFLEQLLAYPGVQQLQQQGTHYIWHRIHWDHNGAALIWTSDRDKHMLIAVRGTELSSSHNVWTDLRYFKRRQTQLGGTRVHSGFWESAENLFQKLKSKEWLPPDAKKQEWRISLTGHSLGEAVACVLGMLLCSNSYVVSELVTFGQPMVTNLEGATLWHSRLPLIRIVNDRDPVALMPPTLPTLLSLLGGRYYHFGTLLRITEKGNVRTHGLESVLQSTHSSFWRELWHGHISLFDHSTTPYSSYHKVMQDANSEQNIIDHYRGDYFDEFLFALYRQKGDCVTEYAHIQPKHNKNPEWVKFKVARSVEVFGELWREYPPQQVTLLSANIKEEEVPEIPKNIVVAAASTEAPVR
jgi:hypothetical protein